MWPKTLPRNYSDWRSEDEQEQKASEEEAGPSDSSSEDEEDQKASEEDADPSDSSSEDEEDIADRSNHIMSLYTPHMVRKIQELPLPPMMKKYLNYNRDMNFEDDE
uniref:BESS domain-containing protein n=1 Tax=Dendroctonus ponderosae TaxID=77166 RepID=A0AAR5P0K1_DENPD